MKKTGWTWTFAVPRESLPDPELFTDPARGETVKRNLYRSVRKVPLPNGGFCYVKHDVPSTPGRIAKEFFRPKNASEFRSAELLRAAGIPCVRLAALGTRFPESVLVSFALEGFRSAAEFRYRAEPEPLRLFLHALAGLVRQMQKQRILHPDFHAGNLMVSEEDPEELCLIDLFGIRRSFWRNPALANAHIFADFADLLQPGEGEALLEESGIRASCWKEILRRSRERILREWPRRAGQILSGRSKFLRMDAIDGVVFYIRNTPWYSFQAFSPEECEKTELPPDRAADLWLESFRSELLHEKTDRIPLAFAPGRESSFLYYRS